MIKYDKRVLYLVRHAKALKSDGYILDIDRSLAEEGVAEAYKIATQLFGKLEIPQLMISSSAIRAFSTALIFQRVLKVPDTALKIESEIYHTDLNDLYELVSGLDDRYHSVMLFGHNPAFSLLASKLDPTVMHMPTSSVVKFEFDAEKWSHASYLNAELRFFIYP